MSSTRTVLNNSTGLQVRKSNKFTAVFVSRARSRLVFNQKGTEHSGQRSRSSFPLFSPHVEPHGDVAEVDRGGAGLSTRPQARTHTHTHSLTLAHAWSLAHARTSIHTRTHTRDTPRTSGPGSTHPHTHTHTAPLTSHGSAQHFLFRSVSLSRSCFWIVKKFTGISRDARQRSPAA